MANPPIPIAAARGTHREVGLQIGMQCKPQIVDMLSHLRGDLPADVTWDAMVGQGEAYLAHSRAAYPRYVEELEGIAEGAGVSFAVTTRSCCWICTQGMDRVTR